MTNTYRDDTAMQLQAERSKSPLKLNLEMKGRCPACGCGRNSKKHGPWCAKQNKARGGL